MGGFLIGLGTVLLILLSLFVVLVVLMQRASANSGMGAALGGGAAESALGGAAGDTLTRATFWGIGIFFVITFCLFLGQLAMQAGDIREERRSLAEIAVTIAAEEEAAAAAAASGELTLPVPASRTDVPFDAESLFFPVPEAGAVAPEESPETGENGAFLGPLLPGGLTLEDAAASAEAAVADALDGAEVIRETALDAAAPDARTDSVEVVEAVEGLDIVEEQEATSTLEDIASILEDSLPEIAVAPESSAEASVDSTEPAGADTVEEEVPSIVE